MNHFLINFLSIRTFFLIKKKWKFHLTVDSVKDRWRNFYKWQEIICFAHTTLDLFQWSGEKYWIKGTNEPLNIPVEIVDYSDQRFRTEIW